MNQDINTLKYGMFSLFHPEIQALNNVFYETSQKLFMTNVSQ